MAAVRTVGPNTTVMSNRWPPFGEDCELDLIIWNTHTTSLSELSVEQATDLLSVVFSRYEDHRTRTAHVIAFLSVGVQALASQPHLHAQVSSLPQQLSDRRVYSDEALLEDFLAAQAEDTVVGESDTLVYVAPSPLRAGEVRIVARTVSDVARHLLASLSAVESVFGPLAYSVVFASSERFRVAHLLPVVYGGPGVYETVLGVHRPVMPVAHQAALLRPAYVRATVG